MKLEVGMYVRNERGIAKYLGLGKDILTNNESNHFKHYAHQHLFDAQIFDVGHDWGDTLSEEEFKKIDKYIKVKPSNNIIDLVEPGDYVNGVLIEKKYKGVDGEIIIAEDCGDPYYDCVFCNKDIKTIVTKEQFENMKYEVKKHE